MEAYVSSYAKNAALRKVHERDCMSSKAVIGTGSRQLLSLPLGAKLPLLPGSGVLLYTTNLGEKLHQPSSEFNLTDPNLHLLKLNYKSLHDPYLSSYYRRKDILKKLKNQGLITENNKIICTLKEFNEYRDYLTSIKLDFERKYAQEQRLLVKQLLNLQDQGLAQGITLSDLQEWLTNESKKNISRKAVRERFFKMIQTEENIKDLIKEQKCCAVLAGGTKDGSPNSKQLVHQIQQEELNMKERSVLMRLEEDVKSEFNLEKRRRKAKEERARKRQESFERKMDHQIQKLREFIERQEQYERCRREGGERGDGESRVKRGISKKLRKTDSRCLDDKWARLSRGECAVLPEGQFAVVQEREKLKGPTKPMMTLEELNRLIQNIITFVVGVLTSIIYPALQKYEEIRSDLDKSQGISEGQDSTEQQIPQTPTKGPQFTDSKIGTDVIELSEKEIETELLEMSEKEVETELLELSEKEVETELLEMSEKELETDLIELSERGMETDLLELSEKEIETDLIEYIETEMETEGIQSSEKEVETDVIEVKEKKVGTEKEDFILSEGPGESQISGESQESEESQESGESEESVGSQDSTECEDYPEVEEIAKPPDSDKRPGSILSLVSAKDQEDTKSPTPGKDLDIAKSQVASKYQETAESQEITENQEATDDQDVAEGELAKDQKSTESLDAAEAQEAAEDQKAVASQEATKESDASKDHDVEIQDVGDKQSITESQSSSISQASFESETQTIIQRQDDTGKPDSAEHMSTGQVSPSEISDIADEMVNDAIVSVNEDPLSSPMKLLPSLDYLCEILSKCREKTDVDTRDVLALCRSQILPAAENVLRVSLEKLTATHPHLVYILTGFPSTQKTNVNSRKLIFNCKVHCLAIDIVNNILQNLRCILKGDIIDTILKSKPTTSCLSDKDNVTVKNEQVPSSETKAPSPKSDDLCLINIEQEFSTPYVHKICLGATKELPEITSELQCLEVFSVIEDMNKYVSTRVEAVTSPKMKPVICTDSPVPPCESPVIDFSEEAKDIVIHILKTIHNEVKIKAVARLKAGTNMSLLKESILVDEILDAILKALCGKNADDFIKLKVERRVKPKAPADPMEIPETKPKLKKRHKKPPEQVISTPKSETLPAVNIPGMVIYPQMEEVSDIPSTKSPPGQKPQRKADTKSEESKKGTKLPSTSRRDSKLPIQHDLNEEELAYKPKDIPEGSLLEKLFKKSEGTSTIDLYPERKPREMQTMPKKCFTKDKKVQTKHKKDKQPQMGKSLKHRKVKDSKQTSKDTKQLIDKESKQLLHKESKLPDKDTKQPLDKETTILPDKESKQIPEKDTEQLPKKGSFSVSDTKQLPDKETASLPDQESTPLPDQESTPLPDQESTVIQDKESAHPTDKASALLPDKQLTKQSDKEFTPPPDEELTSLPKTESTPLPDRESTFLADKESALRPDRESAPLPVRESAPPTDKESAPLSAKESAPPTAPPTDKESALQIDKESAPLSAKESAPPTAKESAPPTAKESAPPTAKESAPPTAKESAPPTAKESAPPTAKESAPPTAKESAPPTAKESAPPTAKETPLLTDKESALLPDKESAHLPEKKSAPPPAKKSASPPDKEPTSLPNKESSASKEVKKPPDKELKQPTGQESRQQMDKGPKQQIGKGSKQLPDKETKRPKVKDKKRHSKMLSEALPYQLELNPEAIKAVSEVIVGLILDRFGLSDGKEAQNHVAQQERKRQYSGGRIDLDGSSLALRSLSKIDSEQFIASDSAGRLATVKKRPMSINLLQTDLMSSRILPPILASDKSDFSQKQEKSMNVVKAIADAISSSQLHIELIWIKSPSTITKLDKLVSNPDTNLASGDIVTNVVDAILDITVSSSNLRLDSKRTDAGRKSVTSISKIASDIFSSVTSVKEYGKTSQSAAAQPQNVPVPSHNSMLLVTEVAEELVSNLLQKCLLFQDQPTTDSQVGVAQLSSPSNTKPSEAMSFGSVVPESQYEKLFSIIMKSVTDILAGKLNLPNENVISSTKVISKHEMSKTAKDTSDFIPETALVMAKPAPTTEVAVKGKPTYLEETRLTSNVAFQKQPGNSFIEQDTIIKKLPKKRRLSLSKISVSPTKSLSSESQKLGKRPERLPEAIPKSKKPITTKKNIAHKKPSVNQNVDKLPLFHKIKEIKVVKDEKSEKIAVKGKSVQKPTHLDNKPVQETLDDELALSPPDSKGDKSIQESFDLLDEKLVKLLTAQLKCEISEVVSTQKKTDAETSETSEAGNKPHVISDSCLELVPEDTSATVLEHIKKLIGLSLHSLEQKPETEKQQICAHKSTETSNNAGEFTECFVKLFNEMTSSVSHSCKLSLTSPDFLNAIYYEIKKSLASYKGQKSESGQVAKCTKIPSEGKRHVSALGDQVTNRLHEILRTKTEMLASSRKDLREQKTTETAKLMKEELIKFALQQLLSDEKFSQEITNIIDEERKVISPPTRNLMAIITPEVLKDIVLKMINILLEKVDSTLSFVPLKNEVSDVSQELVNAIVEEVERKYTCTDSLEVDSLIDETLAEPATKTVQIISFASTLTSLNFVSNVTEQAKKILSLKPLMQNQVVLKKPMKHKGKCLDSATEPVSSYFDLISVDLVRFVLEQIQHIITCSASSNEMQSRTTSSEISIDISSKDTAAPTISSGQSSSSSKTSKKRISFSLPQESVCEKIYSSSISPVVDNMAEETPEDVCRCEPGISGLTKMSEVLVENIVDAVFTSEPSNEETGVCPFVKTPVSLSEDMASKLVQFIRDEKKKCQVSDAVFSESSESFSDLRVEKLVSGTIEEIGASFFFPQVDSGERQICGEEETICECRKQDVKIASSEPDLAENIDVVLQPHVLKSITDYVKQSVYQSQLDQLCRSGEADAFKKDITRQELQDFFLEQVTKENIQKIIECKKRTLYIDKPKSEWIPLEEMKSKENVYTADDDLDSDSVCPLTRKETVISWIPTPSVCDEKHYDENFVSVDELHKILCMEGEKSLSRVTDSILQAPMVETAQSTKTSQLNLLSDTAISNTFEELESSLEPPCVCPFKPMDTDVCKLPDKQRSPLGLSDKESVCALTAFVTSATENIDTYASTCSCPLHFEDRKLSVSSTSTGSSEAESLVQTALCNMWAALPYEKQLGSEPHEHDKPHSSGSSIALDDLSEELLTDALVSIFSHMIDSLLQESSDETSPSSSQLNLFSENIVSGVMQGLKQSPESSLSSLLIPSSSESSGKDSSPKAIFQKGNLRRQAPGKPRVSGRVSSHGKSARKCTEKELSSSSTLADDTSYSTVSRDADHLVETVLHNISSKHNKDLYSSKLIQQEKPIQQKRATQLETSSESSLSLNEFVGGLSKEDVAAIYSYVTDMLLCKSLTQPSQRISQSQSSFLSEKIVADIMQDLQSIPEATCSFPAKPSFDNANTRKLNIGIAAEQPVPTIESSDLKITEGIQPSDSSSAEGTSHTLTSEIDDMVHIALNDLSVTELLDIEEAVPAKIVPHKKLTEFRVNPEIISEHLSVISIKTEPLEVLQQMSLLQTGQDLDEIRKAPIANVTLASTSAYGRRVSFEKSGGLSRRGSLDEQGRLDVKRNEVIARNSFVNLHNPDISKVELLKDVETNKDLILRLVAHDVAPDPDLDTEDESAGEERESQLTENEESILREDVGMFDIDTDSNTEEELAISEGSTNNIDIIIKDEVHKSLLKGQDSIGDKTINDLSVEKLRYINAQSERRQSFEPFVELTHKRAEQEPGNELISLQNWYSLYNVTPSSEKETDTIVGTRREISAEGHIPHPPQEKKPKAKEFSRVRFDPKAFISSSRISSVTVAEMKEREAKHQSKSSPK